MLGDEAGLAVGDSEGVGELASTGAVWAAQNS